MRCLCCRLAGMHAATLACAGCGKPACAGSGWAVHAVLRFALAPALAAQVWFARQYPVHRPNTLLLDNALATMGAGVPSAIAALLVHPERAVLAVVGDGGFMMNSAELATAVRLEVRGAGGTHDAWRRGTCMPAAAQSQTLPCAHTTALLALRADNCSGAACFRDNWHHLLFCISVVQSRTW